MDILKVIKNRRTVRHYTKEKVPINIIKNILEAGRWAPSAHNLQPWRFVVVSRSMYINKIADMLWEKADQLLAGFNIIMRDAAQVIKQTKCVILVYDDMSIVKRLKKFGSPYSEIADEYEMQSISAAIQNMLLCAHSKNMGAAWLGIAIFCANEINEIMKQNGRLVAIVTLGFPQNEQKSYSKRKDVDSISEIIR